MRKIVRLVKTADPCSTNIGVFIATHAQELSDVVTPTEVARWYAESDEVVARELTFRLRALAARDRDNARRRSQTRAEAAARVLGQTARWFGDQAFLEPEPLFDLRANRRSRWVRFCAHGIFDITVDRETIARMAVFRRQLSGLVAWLDPCGLHVRWRGARGGWNWRPQHLDEEEPAILTIRFARASLLRSQVGGPSVVRHGSDGSLVKSRGRAAAPAPNKTRRAATLLRLWFLPPSMKNPMLIIEDQSHFDMVVAFAKKIGKYEPGPEGESAGYLKRQLDYLQNYGAGRTTPRSRACVCGSSRTSRRTRSGS